VVELEGRAAVRCEPGVDKSVDAARMGAQCHLVFVTVRFGIGCGAGLFHSF
jgi:hypothetical protein